MTKILVTGATGNVGRELVAQLPTADVRILSRTPGAGGPHPGAVTGDLARPESLVAALEPTGLDPDHADRRAGHRGSRANFQQLG